MARLARVVVPGMAHHVTQRGNHQEQVFFDDEDRRIYLASLTENADRYGETKTRKTRSNCQLLLVFTWARCCSLR